MALEGGRIKIGILFSRILSSKVQYSLTDRVKFVFVVDSTMNTAKVGGLVANNLDPNSIRSHGIATNDFHRLVQSASRRLVIVKQVSRNQHHITLLIIETESSEKTTLDNAQVD